MLNFGLFIKSDILYKLKNLIWFTDKSDNIYLYCTRKINTELFHISKNVINVCPFKHTRNPILYQEKAQICVIRNISVGNN